MAHRAARPPVRRVAMLFVAVITVMILDQIIIDVSDINVNGVALGNELHIVTPKRTFYLLGESPATTRLWADHITGGTTIANFL